jgi:hypothetical protein
MATALMGQGDSAGAAAYCRSLRGCKDLTLRQQARDLEEVLEAPALQRPRNWSVQMPSLGELDLVEGRSAMGSWRRRPRPEPPPPPPVGATKTPWGFALVAVALLLLTTLLAEGRRSRLVERLREQLRLVESIDLDLNVLEAGCLVLLGTATCLPSLAGGRSCSGGRPAASWLAANAAKNSASCEGSEFSGTFRVPANPESI